MKTIRNVVAGVMLASATMLIAADLKVLKKVPPEFPEEAIRKKVTEGVVRAKLTIAGDGSVAGVEIVEAVPAKAKVFGGAAEDALRKWKFEGTGKQEVVEIKLVFSEE